MLPRFSTHQKRWTREMVTGGRWNAERWDESTSAGLRNDQKDARFYFGKRERIGEIPMTHRGESLPARAGEFDRADAALAGACLSWAFECVRPSASGSCRLGVAGMGARVCPTPRAAFPAFSRCRQPAARPSQATRHNRAPMSDCTRRASASSPPPSPAGHRNVRCGSV